MRGSENKIWPRCSLLILVVINANFCRKSRVTADKFTLKLIIFTHYTNRQFLYDLFLLILFTDKVIDFFHRQLLDSEGAHKDRAGSHLMNSIFVKTD